VIFWALPHRDRDYRIGSNFWKFYLIRTGFILGEPVSLVKVFRLFTLEWIFFGVQSVDTVRRCTSSCYNLGLHLSCQGFLLQKETQQMVVWRWSAFKPPVCICFLTQGIGAAGTVTLPRGSW